MTDIDPVLVERYQLMLQADPKAKVFAPLAEAYRKMGLIDEGIQVCLAGLQFHPDFASGRVALGRLYFAKNQFIEAARELQKAVDLSPENLLAQSLLGETFIKLKQPKEALNAYKMLLFLSPNDERAQSMVKKLESLTADEYDEDVFAMTKLTAAADRVQNLDIEVATPIKPVNDTDSEEESARRDLERHLSLADAFLVRNDFERAMQTLENAEKTHGHTPEIARRMKILNQRYSDDPIPERPPQSREQQLAAAKVALLQELGRRIQSRRRP